MKKESFLAASVTLVAFCFAVNNAFANDEYTNLKNAIQNGEQQSYTLVEDANSDGSTALGDVNNSKNSFTINGDGHSITGSEGKAVGITVHEGQDVTINNVSSFAEFLTRGSNTAGAITNSGNLSVDGVNFINNSGYDIQNNNNQRDVTGGAIYNLGSGVISSIVDSTFEGNHTYNWADKFSDGGAIFNRGLIKDIQADFTGNYAVGYQDRPNFLVPYQHATAAGGAIANHEGTIESLVGNFVGNSAYSYSRNARGGAIYNTGSITMNGGSFDGNLVLSDDSTPTYKGFGGAVYNEGTFVAIDTDFTNNSASDDGGAIYNNGGTVEIYAKEKDVNLSGNTIAATYTLNDDRKVVQAEGGTSNAIYNEGESFLNLKAEEGKSITIEDTVSKASDANVSVAINGDGQKGSVNIENTFDATNISLGGGEAKISSNGEVNASSVAVNGGTLNLEGTINADEKVDLNNGTINVKSGSTLNAENLNISGGTMKLEDDLTSVGTVNATSGLFDTQDGVIANRNLGNISLNGDVNLNIDVDFTTATGDVISANILNPDTTNSLVIDTINVVAFTEDLPSSSIQVIDTAISDYVKLSNSYTINGGNPTLKYFTSYDNTLGTLTFDFEKNLATSILITYDIRNYNMAGNESAPDMGLQTMGGSNSTLTVAGNGYKVTGNGYSGVTIDSNNTLVLNDVASWSGFKRQTVDEVSKGGAFNLENGNLGDLSSMTISNNSAISTNNDAMGGAIYTTGSSKIGKIKALFTGNKAQGVNAMGGAIYNDATETMQIEDATFTNNTSTGSASSKGGAIYNNGTLDITANANDVAFKGNKAQKGGAIYNEGIVNLTSGDKTSVVFYDDINGSNGKINVDNKGVVEFHNSVAENDINIKSGTVNVVSNENAINISNGKVDVGDGSALNFNANKKITVSSEITGGGVININDSSVVSTNVTVNSDGSAKTSKVKAPTNGSIDFNNKIVAKAINSYAGSSKLSGDTTVEDLNILGGELTANSIVLSVANNIENEGTLNVTNNATIDANSLISNKGTIAASTSSVINAAGAITNEGTLSLASKSVLNAKDLLSIGSEASLTADDGSSIDAEGALTNEGTLSLSASSILNAKDSITNKGALIADDKSEINADGVIDNEGTLSAKANSTLNAKEAINNKGTLTANSKSTINADETITNEGTLSAASGSTINAKNSIINKGKLEAKASSTINADKLANADGTLNLTGSNLNIENQDTEINGVINILGSNADTDVSNIVVNGTNKDISGTLNIGDSKNSKVHSTLNLKSANILQSAALNVAKGNALNIAGDNFVPNVYIDGDTDKWSGDIILTNGDVTLENMNINLGSTKTTKGGDLPYYSQTSGSLKLINSNMSTKDASLISGGDLNIDSNSKFTSLNKAFSVDNLTIAGTINALNGNNENYAIKNAFNIGDGLSDNKADFAINFGARSNLVKGYDSFGSDTTTINAANGKDAIINVYDWHLSGDIDGYGAPIDRHIILNNLFKGKFNEDHEFIFTATDKEILTPIGYYRVSALGGGDYSVDLTSYNPKVFRGQVTTIAQYQNQLAIDDMLFGHSMVDQGFKGNDNLSFASNRYASANDLFAPYQYSRKDGGLWMKNYSTFEKLNMNQGLHVGNIAYGSLIGADFGLKQLKGGWEFMPTVYLGYNGAHQHWNTVDTYQNGAQLGFMGTWYKNNFLVGALAYGGVYNNHMSTPRGGDNTFNYFAGASTKAAYNLRIGKNWSLQPNLLLAYNYFGQENWHSDFGQMGMMSGMLHGVNIAPGVNLIWEKETFSTYLTLQYMYNANQSVGGRAGNVYLPNVHMDRGYIQYGLGVNKKFTDRFSAYIQAVLRNVGRTGAGLQLGFEWRVGKKASKKASKKAADKA